MIMRNWHRAMTTGKSTRFRLFGFRDTKVLLSPKRLFIMPQQRVQIFSLNSCIRKIFLPYFYAGLIKKD
jgi:hypothetical protein